MSKVDAMRALREARRTAVAKAPAAAPARAAGAAARAAAPRAAAPAAAPAEAPEVLAVEELCGHTAIGGRRCTRPKGHSEKNHRYAPVAG